MMHFRNFFLLVSLLFFSVVAAQTAALPGKWKILEKPDQTVEFRIRNFGFWVNGTFSGLRGDIQFNPSRPENASVKCSIPVSSVNTGIKKRDSHLQEEEYFWETRFPRIVLESSSIKSEGGDFKFIGKLTIRGVAGDIRFPFSFSRVGEQAVVAAQFTLNRRDYKVGPERGPLGEDVEITVRVLLQPVS